MKDTTEKATTRQRMALCLAASTVVMALAAGPAAGFEPPADPNDNFTCDGGPVAGHPGHRGLSRAMMRAASPTAWNAANKAGPVTTCG